MKKPASTGKHATVVTIPHQLGDFDRNILRRLFPTATIANTPIGPNGVLETADMRIRYGNIGRKQFKEMLQNGGPFTLMLINGGQAIFLIRSNGSFAWVAMLTSEKTYVVNSILVDEWLNLYDSISGSGRTAWIAVGALMKRSRKLGLGSLNKVGSLEEAKEWIGWDVVI